MNKTGNGETYESKFATRASVLDTAVSILHAVMPTLETSESRPTHPLAVVPGGFAMSQTAEFKPTSTHEPVNQQFDYNQTTEFTPIPTSQASTPETGVYMSPGVGEELAMSAAESLEMQAREQLQKIFSAQNGQNNG